MGLATQRVAAYFDFHQALGTPFLAGFYAKWAIFGWKAQFLAQDTYGFMETAVTHSQALFLIPQFLIIGTWLFFMKGLRGNEMLHGSARWATEPEIRLMGYFEGGGVYIGGYVKKLAGAALIRCALLGKPKEVADVLAAQRAGTSAGVRADAKRQGRGPDSADATCLGRFGTGAGHKKGKTGL